jgi:hypothetical protein
VSYCHGAMLNWNKQYLDAYLAAAEMACDWNVQSSYFIFYLRYITVYVWGGSHMI